MARLWLFLAAFFGFTGVALGAFAAHGLKKVLSPSLLAVFQTATHYQMLHALALFGVALLALRGSSRLLSAAGTAFTVGVVLFSGSLYLLALTGVGSLGMITPLGGLAFLIGWALLGLKAWKLS